MEFWTQIKVVESLQRGGSFDHKARDHANTSAA